MSLKVPYTDNLTLNAKLPGQVTADFKEAEQEDARDDAKLDQEIQDRKDADAEERSDRIAADNAEQEERINADKYLQDQVDSLRTDVTDLQRRMKIAEATISQLYEAVFGIPSAILNEASSVDDDNNDDQPLQEINTERNGILDAQ